MRNYGKKCWELDAMDPNDLRDRVEEAIKDEIESGRMGALRHARKPSRRRCVGPRQLGEREAVSILEQQFSPNGENQS